MGLAIELVATTDIDALLHKLATGQLDPNLPGFALYARRYGSAEAFARDGGPYDEESAWLWEWAQTCVGHADLGKGFSSLVDVLVAVDSSLEDAILGRQKLPCSRDPTGFACATQGVPFRFVPAADCMAIADRLRGTSLDEVRAAVQAKKVSDPTVYKHHEAHRYVEDLLELRRIYDIAVEQSASVLVVID